MLGTVSGIPTKKRNHPSIYLRFEGESFLWDCGEGTQRQLTIARLNFMKLERIFITHWHADHWAGLIGLMQTMNLEGRKKPLYIYGPEAERFVGDLLDLDYWGPGFKIIPINVPFEGIEESVIYKADNYEILSIPVNHTVPSVAYAFREYDVKNVDIKKATKLYGLKQGPLVGQLKEKGNIEYKGKKIKLDDVAVIKKGIKVVYSGDTRKCDTLVKLSKKADILIHDSTFGEDDAENKMHTGAKDAALVAKKAGVDQLILTHFSRRYLDVKPLEDEAKKVFKNTKAAYDFMKITLKRK